MNSRCEANDEAISLLVDGDLDPTEKATLLTHLERCGRCRGVQERYKAFRSAAAELPVQRPPAELRAGLEPRLEAFFGAPKQAGAKARVLRLSWKAALPLAAGLMLAAGLFQFVLRDPGPGSTVERPLDVLRDAEDGSQVLSLVQKLKDPDPEVRLGVAEALGLLGARAEAAVPDLETRLLDEDPRVRKAAAEAIEKIRGAERTEP